MAMVRDFSANFYRDPRYGNTIDAGEELIVKFPRAEIVSGFIISPEGKIWKHGRKVLGRRLLADQSHENDEDKDPSTINFKLRKFNFKKLRYEDFPEQTYILFCWFWDNDTMKGGKYIDEFYLKGRG